MDYRDHNEKTSCIFKPNLIPHNWHITFSVAFKKDLKSELDYTGVKPVWAKQARAGGPVQANRSVKSHFQTCNKQLKVKYLRGGWQSEGPLCFRI